MLYVFLKGHDYKYEVAELIKLFTSEFKFKDSNANNNIESKHLINRLIYENGVLFSSTEYYENGNLKYESIQNIENMNLEFLDGFDSSKTIEEFLNRLDSESKRNFKKLCKENIKKSMFVVLKQVFNSYVPWGILTGIRPVKIVHNLMDKKLDDNSIRTILKDNYFIIDKKIDLALEIAKRERLFMYPIDKNKISLYVSIPFCPTRCVYCSFPSNSLKQFGHLKREYVYKLIEEIKGFAKVIKETKKEVETLYIGGGTPTTLDEEELDLLINSLFNELDLSKIKEFTVEAGRPDTITEQKLRVLKKHNVSRISINPQTMNDETVALLSKLDVDKHIDVEIKLDELDLTSAESKATYAQIKEYVLEKFGLKVSTLYIAQIKKKCGIELREHYNKSKKDNQAIPQCTPEKEEAIMDALRHFKMI